MLAERDFRKLFASRLVSQTGDGVFNAGFAAYAFFSAQSFPNPVAAVDAFAVLYLPYSLIGPFAFARAFSVSSGPSRFLSIRVPSSAAAR